MPRYTYKIYYKLLNKIFYYKIMPTEAATHFFFLKINAVYDSNLYE